MLTKSYTKWILIANLIAWPAAYYAMSRWLQNYAYHISINWWVFVFAGGTALFISLITVSIQAIKAAASNPVKSLRNE
jgi:putative ABC transport system permease protein